MANDDYYYILEVHSTATQAEIKQAYRRLAKLFHPDSLSQTANHDKIARLNVAYEVLGDPQRRAAYDQQRRYGSGRSPGYASDDLGDRLRRQHQRTAAAQKRYHAQQTGQQADEHLELWLKQVYNPVSRLIYKIIEPLRAEINELSADPFDDELMQAFLEYLEDCQGWLTDAERAFRSLPNPAPVAGAAASLFYSLGQVRDGLEQLEFFTNNYDEHYLHTGQELFRIAKGLRYEAQVAVRELVAVL